MAREFRFEQLYGEAAGVLMDPTPVALPVGFKRPETLAEQVARLVRIDLSRRAGAAGFETFDEANDFDVPDDPVDPSTPFEEFFDPVLGMALTPDEMRRFDAQFRKKYLEAQGSAIKLEDRAQALAEHVSELREARKARKTGVGGVHPKSPPTPVDESKAVPTVKS